MKPNEIETLSRTGGFRQLTHVASALAGRGASEGVVRDLIDATIAAQDGIYDADQARAIPGPPDFRTWCRDVLRPAVLA